MPRTGLSSEGLKEIAMQLAAEKMRSKGFEKVRLSDIAREMHISHAALYAHFTDKSALLDAVAERWLRSVRQKLEDLCRERKSALTKIRQWFLEFHSLQVDKMKRDPEVFKSYEQAFGENKRFVMSHQHDLRQQLTDLVNEALTKKIFKKKPADQIVQILLEATRGFHEAQYLLAGSGARDVAGLEALLDVLLRGCAK